MKILTLYHSGSGSTRTISELLDERLSKQFKTEIAEISFDFNYSRISSSDLLIYLFPTYHCKPSLSSIEFIEKMNPLDKPLPAYMIATCGLYLGNTLRMMFKTLNNKNLIVKGYKRFRGPGSDELLYYVPKWINFVFRYEHSIKKKLDRIVKEIIDLGKSKNNTQKKPLFQWYTLVNTPLSYLGGLNYHRYKKKIYISPERCNNCKYCVKNCIRGCFSPGEQYPAFDYSNCEFCLKCIHNCPKEAILFSKSMISKPRLNKKFYRKLKDVIDWEDY